MIQRLRGTWLATADWRGVADRTEFWTWLLVVDVPVSLIALLITGNGTGLIAYVGLALILVVAVPTVSLTARRLHDSGRSAGWMIGPLVFGASLPPLAILFALSCFDVCGPRSRGFEIALFTGFWLFVASSVGLLVLLLWPSRRLSGSLVQH